MIVGTCPRCNGTLTLQHDNGWEYACIQCGYIRPVKASKENRLNHAQYDVSMPYTASPMTCQCLAYDTIPRFARLLQDQMAL
jgi:hypothetical protein